MLRLKSKWHPRIKSYTSSRGESTGQTPGIGSIGAVFLASYPLQTKARAVDTQTAIERTLPAGSFFGCSLDQNPSTMVGCFGSTRIHILDNARVALPAKMKPPHMSQILPITSSTIPVIALFISSSSALAQPRPPKETPNRPLSSSSFSGVHIV